MSYKYEDFLEWPVKQLQGYLSVRGLNTSGRHVELVARSFSAMELKLPIIQSEEEQRLQLQKDYLDKCDLLELPDPFSFLEQSTEDLTKWPLLDTGHIFSYILKNREFNTDYIGKYKDQKAYSYFDSGFVGQILCYNYVLAERNVVILFANVRASMSIHTEKRLWVAVDVKNVKDPKILSADCSCMAGANECCNHVIAVLYKIQYANAKGFISPACTEKACQWNKSSKKEIEPQRIRDIIVRKKTASKEGNVEGSREELRMKALNEFDPRREFHRQTSDQQKHVFFQNIEEVNKSAVLFKSLDKRVQEIDISNLTIDCCVSRTLEHDFGGQDTLTHSFLSNLHMTEASILKVEKETLGQSDNKLWFDMRRGRLTASKLHDYYTKISAISKSHNKKGIKTTPMVADIIYGAKKNKHSCIKLWQ